MRRVRMWYQQDESMDLISLGLPVRGGGGCVMNGMGNVFLANIGSLNIIWVYLNVMRGNLPSISVVFLIKWLSACEITFDRNYWFWDSYISFWSLCYVEETIEIIMRSCFGVFRFYRISQYMATYWLSWQEVEWWVTCTWIQHSLNTALKAINEIASKTWSLLSLNGATTPLPLHAVVRFVVLDEILGLKSF